MRGRELRSTQEERASEGVVLLFGAEGTEGSLVVGDKSGVAKASAGFGVGWIGDFEVTEKGFRMGPSGSPMVFRSSARVVSSCSAEGEQPVEQAARIIIKSDV